MVTESSLVTACTSYTAGGSGSCSSLDHGSAATSPTSCTSSSASSPSLVNNSEGASNHHPSIVQRRQGRRKNLKLDIETARQYRSIGKLSFHFGGSQSSAVAAEGGPGSAGPGSGLFSPVSATAANLELLSCSGTAHTGGLRPIENHIIGNPHFVRCRKAVRFCFFITN